MFASPVKGDMSGKDSRFVYNILPSIPSFDSLKLKVQSIPDSDWEVWQERKVFHHQVDSLTIPLLCLPDRDNFVFKKKIENSKYLNFLKKELEECINVLSCALPGGEIKRSMLVKLPTACKVKEHVDIGYHLESCHRIHIPIITDSLVGFFCNGQKIPMQEGTTVDFNNNLTHSVNNSSSNNRIHLIIDWGIKNDPYYME